MALIGRERKKIRSSVVYFASRSSSDCWSGFVMLPVWRWRRFSPVAPLSRSINYLLRPIWTGQFSLLANVLSFSLTCSEKKRKKKLCLVWFRYFLFCIQATGNVVTSCSVHPLPTQSLSGSGCRYRLPIYILSRSQQFSSVSRSVPSPPKSVLLLDNLRQVMDTVVWPLLFVSFFF